jgi:hypothetical protein
MLATMQMRGVPVHQTELLQYVDFLQKTLTSIEREAQQWATPATTLNLLSPQQAHFLLISSFFVLFFCNTLRTTNYLEKVRHVLYEQLKLDGGHRLGRTPETNEKSTSKAALQKLSAQHPLPMLVLFVLSGGPCFLILAALQRLLNTANWPSSSQPFWSPPRPLSATALSTPTFCRQLWRRVGWPTGIRACKTGLSKHLF